MTLNIQDLFTNIEYNFVKYIIEKMQEQIEASWKGEFGNFKFHHYLLLTHLILDKNIGYFSIDFIDQTSDLDGYFPMELWTWVWDRHYP